MMFGGPRRKTGGPNFGATGRTSTAITPTKRTTDLGAAHSVRKNDNRMSFGQGPSNSRPSLFQRTGGPSKDFKAAVPGNAAKVYNFFVDTEGANAPSEKTIRTPAGKGDFVTMFELLYQHLSKDYEFPSNGVRLEDEFTNIMKALGYPHALKPSFFQPIGSSHGYPHLLDALAWLVEAVEINEKVRLDTQNIIMGDFMEPDQVQDKVLSYSWLSKTFFEYSNNRKVLEDKADPFWATTKCDLRNFFENNDESADMITSSKNMLEQLRFDCEEIEADKGNEQGLLDEIARIRDDIRKAQLYLDETMRVVAQSNHEYQTVVDACEAKLAELEKVKTEVAELKERIEEQKRLHGLSGKEVRQMNAENSKDKEMLSDVNAEIERATKMMWRLRDAADYKEPSTRFYRLISHMHQILDDADVHPQLEPIAPPSSELDLKAGWDAINNLWLPEVNRQLQHKKLELETENARFLNKFEAIEERATMEQEMLNEATKKEDREERVRRNEREEWKAARFQKEKRCDQLENEKDILVKQMHLDGSLDRDLQEETEKAAKLSETLEQKQTAFEQKVREKIDEMMASTAEMEQEKLEFHKECVELEMVVKNS